jgi:expansin (peptidoglycan-binding protein)
MGTLLDPIEETVDISAAAATTINLATQSAALKGALLVQSVEVLTGAAAAGSRIVVPSTDAASTTEVVLSADGTTLTFEANVETVRVRWIAASKTALTTDFPTTGVG